MSACRVALPSALAAASDLACCWGAALDGPEHCTCWTPEYDVVQVPPDADAPVSTRARMCGSCAYRAGTQAARRFAGQLDDLVTDVDVFYCHDGSRQVLRLRHPNGTVLERTDVDGPDDAAWDPPFVDGIPYRADGQPAQRCAGWAARRRALLGPVGDR